VSAHDAASRPVLRPWQVPWLLSPSGSFLSISHTEEIWECRVETNVILGPLAGGQDDTSNGSQRIRVDFDGGLWSRISPTSSESEPLGHLKLDWSEVPFRGPVADVGARIREYEERWLQTRLCPDPGAYEVHGSSWAGESGAARLGLRHFLLVGTEAYAEVLAKGWRWSFTASDG